MKKNRIKASHITAEIDLNQIIPSRKRVLVRIKSWPAQSKGGIIVSDSYTVIRNEQYIAQVEEIGEDCILVKKDNLIVISMYSGFHIVTKTGHAKILMETDILSIKSNDIMKKQPSFEPKTFTPGINYILVELNNVKEVVTKSGIVTSTESQSTKNDSITKIAKVISIGPTNEYGKEFKAPEVGDNIILDSFVGLTMSSNEVTSDKEYRIMYIFDILGYVK